MCNNLISKKSPTKRDSPTWTRARWTN